MKKVLIVQSTFPPEGSSTVAVWMIEALKKECSVSLLTWKPIDLGEINRFHSTSLSNSELTVLCVNPALRKLIELDTDPGSIQKTAYLSRVCKRTRSGLINTSRTQKSYENAGLLPFMRLVLEKTMMLSSAPNMNPILELREFSIFTTLGLITCMLNLNPASIGHGIENCGLFLKDILVLGF